MNYQFVIEYEDQTEVTVDGVTVSIREMDTGNVMHIDIDIFHAICDDFNIMRMAVAQLRDK